MTNEVQGFLLRCITSVGVLSVKEVEDLLRKHSNNDEYSVSDVVKGINKRIKPYQQTVKIVTDEITEEQVVIFLSLGYDDATKAQNFFSPTELEYYRLLIEEIMSTDTRQISRAYALNLIDRVKGTFTKACAQKLLDTWCRMRYLDEIESEYALGIRAIHEFESYLRQNMPDIIEECSLCKQIVFRGPNCPYCGVAAHTQCLLKYVKKITKWPCCKQNYDSRKHEDMESIPSASTSTVCGELSQEISDGSEELQEVSQMADTSQRRTSKKRKRSNM